MRKITDRTAKYCLKHWGVRIQDFQQQISVPYENNMTLFLAGKITILNP